MGGHDNTTTNEIRYAPYLESAHRDILTEFDSMIDALNAGVDPYDGYTDLEVDDAFFGVGVLITEFPSLYDRFSSLMSDVSPGELYDTIFDDVVNNNLAEQVIAQESISLSDELETEVIPRFELGMRDVNAVMSSSYVIGKALIEANRVKALAKFSSTVKSQLVPFVVDRWKTELEWNKQVVDMYAQIMKFYFIAKPEIDSHNRENQLKHLLWPFTTSRYMLDALGILNNAVNQKSTTEGASTASKALGGAMMGAGAGAMFGPAGAGIGGALGLAAGLLS
jgi:hypothetical protein